MKLFIPLLFLFILLSCNGQKRRPLAGKSEFQKELNTTFKDATTSPLTKKGLKIFTGLSFYPIDNKYKVKARLVKTPDGDVFKFPTTTDRVVEYKKYGDVFFTIDNKELQLAVYKNKRPAKKYKDDLFLPFLDATSGNTSYGGGRFIDVLTTDEQEDGTIMIDFNKAYNPYCAYSDRYSCPITPRSNFINIPIKAGVMAYDK